MVPRPCAVDELGIAFAEQQIEEYLVEVVEWKAVTLRFCYILKCPAMGESVPDKADTMFENSEHGLNIRNCNGFVNDFSAYLQLKFLCSIFGTEIEQMELIMSLFSLTGILNSKGTVVVKDTALTQIKFKSSIPSEVRQIGRVLEKECGVDNLTGITDNTNGVWSHKHDLREYGVYLDVTFGTELSTITTFKGLLRGVSFNHATKSTNDGLVENFSCVLDIVKNYDKDADFDMNHYVKYKEIDPTTGKKILVPMVISAEQLNDNPVDLEEVE